MSIPGMPASFAPTLPTLPSYPTPRLSPPASPSHRRHKKPFTQPPASTPYYNPFHHPTPSASSASSSSSSSSLYTDNTNIAYSPYKTPNTFTVPDLRASLNSTTLPDRRPSLNTTTTTTLPDIAPPPTSRKRGFSSLDAPSASASAPDPKRRILSVVGSTVGGVLRGAWEIFRPRFFHDIGEDAGDGDAYDIWSEKPPASPGVSREGSPEPVVAEVTQWVVVAAEPECASKAPARPKQRRSNTMPSSTAARVPSLVTSRSLQGRGARSAGKKVRVAPIKRPLRQAGSPVGGYSPVHRRGQSWAGGRREEEEEEDEDMRRFNEKLKAMIREGKEALGAKVEVVYDDEDDMF